MNLRCVLGALTLLLFSSCATTNSRLYALVGQRDYDKGDWAPVEEQTSFEIGSLDDRPNSNWGLEGGFSYSGEDDEVLGMDVESDFIEVFFGGRYTFGDREHGGLHPYIGIGGSAIRADLEGTAGSEDDTSLGVYFRAGLGVRIDSGSSIGIDYRVLTATDVELFGVDGDADFDQIAAYLMFSF